MRWVAALLALGTTPAFSQEDGADFFEKRIRPVLVERCYECHSAQAKTLKGNLFLDSREGTLKGGDLGPAVVAWSPAQSLLLTAIKHADEDLKMPPKKKLPADVIADFEKWIMMGAPDPRVGAAPKRKAINLEQAKQYWAFKPVALPALPAVSDASWERTPVDRFILAKLEAKGLKPAPDADKLTLIRRATFDLIGLPPTPEEIDAFLADRSPDAFTRVIDRLLASPHYGERWGRHWLDVVRYADTAGDNSDFPIPQIHKYRNYVLKAFNEDKPYDQFIREQLAGDLLPHRSEPERLEKIIATGYIANAKRFGSTIIDYPWHLTIEDTLDNLGRTFLGLTVSCSRCHDHKFDPITNEDYYALYGIFASTKYPWPGIELEQSQRDFIPLVPAAQAESVLKERAAKKAALDASIKAMEAHKKDVDKAVALGDEKDDETVRLKEYLADLTKILKTSTTERDTWQKQPLPFDTAYAVAEAPKTGNAKVQIKGDPAKPGVEIPRRFLEVLGGRSLASDIKGSGRLQLAEWIADPSNPLTARVMANRLWHYHFGKGIVPTPSDFGRQGRPPSHSELLDWLASRFIDSGWSVKAMHRTILLSRVWQLSSHDDGTGALLDPDNDLLQHQRRRRLDAESIRDSLLAVSGGLDRSIGGPHPFPAMTTWAFTQHKPFIAVYDNPLRSVYLMQQRIRRHPYFGIFDGADPSTGTATRVTSTTTLQALYFLNDPFVHEQASKLAARVRKERDNDGARIDRAYRLTLGRPAEGHEVKGSLDYLASLRSYGDEAQAWDSYVRILLRLSEFVYVR